MPLHHNHRCLINVFIFLSFSVVVFLVNDVQCHQCYACGEDSDLPNCDKFNPSLDFYTKECPTNTKSCSLEEVNDVVTRRDCESHPLSDCQKANGVLYCYCSTNLCNGIKIEKSRLPNTVPSDDEDMSEGSGFNKNQIEEETVTKTPEIVVKMSNSGISLQKTYLVLLSVILIY